MSASASSTPARRAASALAIVVAAFVALAAAPWWADRASLRLLSEIYAYVALASLWNLLAGYAGLVSVGQQAYVGLGAYVLFALAMLAGVHPLLAIPLAGARRRDRRGPGRGADLPAARALLRDRHLGGGRGVPAARLADLGARRRLRHQPAGRRWCSRSRRRRQMREFIIYWIALAQAVGGPRRHRLAAALALRACAHRDPRQRARRAHRTASTSRASNTSSMSRSRSAPPWSAR